MIVKFCIISCDRDKILRFFNLDITESDSFTDVNVMVKNKVCSICSELGISRDDVDVFEEFYFFD